MGPTIRRAELTDDETTLTAANDLAVRRALEAAGVEFIDENGGGPACDCASVSAKSSQNSLIDFSWSESAPPEGHK